MKVAIFSDLHLGVSGDSQEWHQIALDWIDSFTSYLDKEKIKDVFFLGDWFNNRTAIFGTTLDISSKVFEKLQKYNVYIFPGNHDLFYKNQSDVSSISHTKYYPNVHYYDKPFDLKIGGKVIRLCPWNFNPVELDGTADYLFGHFEINTFQMNSSTQLCEDGMKLSDLLKKYNGIFSGHFHKAQNRVYSSGYIQYVGNPFQTNYGEADDDKGFWVLDLEKDTSKFIKNKISPRFCKILLSQLITTPIKKIGEILQNNFVRLSIDKNITTNDLNELVTLISTCRPRECDIDWDNSSFSQDINSKTDFMALEFIDALTEYTKLLDIEDPKKTISYLTNIYKKVTE